MNLEDMLTSASLRFQRKRRGKAATPATEDEPAPVIQPPAGLETTHAVSAVPVQASSSEEEEERPNLSDKADSSLVGGQDGDDASVKPSASEDVKNEDEEVPDADEEAALPADSADAPPTVPPPDSPPPSKPPHRGRRPLRQPDYGALIRAVEVPGAPVAEAAEIPAPASLPLSGTTVVLSGLYDVGGAVAQYASADQSPRKAARTADPLAAVVAAGARAVGRTLTEELHLGLLAREGAALNPAAPDAAASGTGAGGAMAVSAGLADFALGVDHLAGLRIHAAACGVYGFRATARSAAAGGVMGVAGTLDALAIAARDPALLRRAGVALGLPGGGPGGQLVQLVLAEDVFARFAVGDGAEGGARALAAAQAAARRWAPDCVARGRVLAYLQHAVPAAAEFLDEGEEGDVLEGLRRAAAAAAAAAFLQAHGHRLLTPEDTSPEVLQQLQAAAEVPDEEVDAARAVMAQAAAGMRDITRSGNVLLLPALPGPPPSRSRARSGVAADAAEAWERGALQLAALAALAGVPQVCIPVPIPGRPPAALALIGMAKSDLRLLAVAEKLGPLLAEAAAALAAEAAEAAAVSEPEPLTGEGGEGPAGGGAVSEAAVTANGHVGASAKAAKPVGRGVKAREAAEAAKREGNAAVAAGDYEGAAEAYTRAAAADPGCAVYFSNRALCYLKVLRFEEAEADCDRALALELNPKTLLRRGTARRGRLDLSGALRDYQHVLSLEPNNKQAREELRNLKQLEEAMIGTAGPGPPADHVNGGWAEQNVYV
ncbi:hypothetical protein WJX81_005197 [Elliptochloris bilobata]|uniref:Amidase domain-containing protein n=1 Tax=Elliptochloris bilobata TaxID=381761 RepID=A0AAW1S0F3_9CHLO